MSMFEEERNISALSKKIDEMLEKYKDLLAQNEGLNQKLNDKDADITSLNQKLDLQQSQIRTKDTLYNDLQVTVEELVEKQKYLSSIIDSQNVQNRNNEKNINSLKEELALAQQNNNKLSDSVHSLLIELDSKNEDITRYSQEISELSKNKKELE